MLASVQPVKYGNVGVYTTSIGRLHTEYRWVVGGCIYSQFKSSLGRRICS